jgi:hypothetical protein
MPKGKKNLQVKPENLEEQQSFKDLKQELVNLGMPLEEVNLLKSTAQLTAVINSLKASKATIEVDVAPVLQATPKKEEKVTTLEEVESLNEKRVFEKEYSSKADRMRTKLEGQPKVRVLLPLEGEEKQGIVEWITDARGIQKQVHLGGAIDQVMLNGYKFIIPKGVYYDVPQQIAEVLSNAYNQTQNAGANISLDRVDPRTGRRMSEIL